ncbi:unnamed protein product [Mytilus coruscus]|uniref:Uncharacterized protein n=1 Tax=Mytilus coruscus TaxID=42192 RepID=A0A6J8DYQ9_MYTCO|nr:unnamed protein product [Mytilus coruscus]
MNEKQPSGPPQVRRGHYVDFDKNTAKVVKRAPVDYGHHYLRGKASKTRTRKSPKTIPSKLDEMSPSTQDTVTKAVVQVISPVFASEFDVNFETVIAESFHLSPTETAESRKNTMEQTLNMSMQSINSALTDNDNDPELDKCLINLQENHHCNSNTETKQNVLKAIQRSRYIKVWHDHSDVVSHTYINFMISYMYDSANFLTSKEYLERNPTIIDIQKIVERPHLYILGQSASTDQDQRTSIQTRMEDILELSEGTKFQDVTFIDQIKVFSGDNPARQFEAGQQRGGAYSCLCGISSKAHINLESCYKQKPYDLENRRKIVTEGYLWKKIEGGNFNPFKNFKKRRNYR